MKKIFRNKFLLAAAVLGVMASCSDDDDVTLDTRSVKPVVSIDQISASLVEGDSMMVTITADKPTNTAMDFKLELVGSEGSFREYEVVNGVETNQETGAGIIGHVITMPAYATTYTFKIKFLRDLDVEPTETFVFALTSAVNGRGLVADNSGTITATVADYVSNDVGVKLTWDQNTTNYFGTISEGTFTSTNAQGEPVEKPYTGYDFDIYIISAATSDEVTDYMGATGNSPEMTILSADMPDGEYWIFADLFDSGDEPIVPFTHNLTMQISKFGNWSVTIPIEGYTSDHATSAPDGLDLEGGATLVATLVKTGTTYVLQNEAGDVLAQGRFASLANNFKSIKSKK